MSGYTEWTAATAREWIAVPREWDDKYSRGVLGMVTGSDDYPGAAVVGVDAALHTGLGMVRYLGPDRPTSLVLNRRPEAVAIDGRVQAWLLGSGIDESTEDPLTAARLSTALSSGHPLVLDAGAIPSASAARGPVVITPHHSELARLLRADVAEVAAEPENWAGRAADSLGLTVVLKGHTTLVCGVGGSYSITAPTTWLATAGTGDSLAGVLGALVATHAKAIAEDVGVLTHLAATAVLLHGLAAERAGAGGPFTVLDLNAAIPAVMAAVMAARPKK
jgi:ADP-dependent NAD(P)H-hydrate dehydratase / NAD(P)H-hydrate epimerase